MKRKLLAVLAACLMLGASSVYAENTSQSGEQTAASQTDNSFADQLFEKENTLSDAFGDEEYEKAISTAKEILKIDPGNMVAYRLGSYALLESEKYEEAYTFIKQQLDLVPGDESSLYNLACVAAKLGKDEEAIALLKQLIEINSDYKSTVAADPDFDSIRETDAYKNLMAISVLCCGELLTFDVPPMLVSDRTLVPLRAIFEALDTEVSYEDATRTVRAEKDGMTIELVIGELKARVNGEEKVLDVPSMEIDGRTLVPLRFVGEALGADVDWDGDNEVVFIYTPGPYGEADYETVKKTLDEKTAVLAVDGLWLNPYLLDSTTGISFIVLKDKEALDLFQTLSYEDQDRYISETVTANFGLLVGCQPVYVHVVYDGKTYYYGEYDYTRNTEVEAVCLEKGRPILVARQYCDNLGNYADFYKLPEDEQVTTNIDNFYKYEQQDDSKDEDQFVTILPDKGNAEAETAFRIFSTKTASSTQLMMIDPNGKWLVEMPKDWVSFGYANKISDDDSAYLLVANPDDANVICTMILKSVGNYSLRAYAETISRILVEDKNGVSTMVEGPEARIVNGVDFYYTRMDTVTDKDTTVIGKFYFRQYEDYIFIFQLSNTDGVETEEFKQVLASFTDSIKA